MSTYYYTKIFTRQRVEDGKPNPYNWEETDSGCTNIYKSLLCGWDSTLDSTYPGKELDEKASTYYTYEFVGLYDKTYFEKTYNSIPLDTIDPMYEYHSKNTKDCNNVVITDIDNNPLVFETVTDALKFIPEEIKVYSKTEVERLQNNNQSTNSEYILLEDFVDMSPEEKQAKYINVYYKHKNNYNGKFYDYKSFIDKKKELDAEYKKHLEKKFFSENLLKSLDYMKLSEEEKENVNETFLYVDENIEETEAQIAACNYFITLVSWFDDDRNYPHNDDSWRGRDVLFYIYSL